MRFLLITVLLLACSSTADPDTDAGMADKGVDLNDEVDAQVEDAETEDVGLDAKVEDMTIPDSDIVESPLANLAADGTLDGRNALAFPGAGGYGQNATGGRGGVVVHVTTTADNCTAGDGEVTWREAVSSCGDVEDTARYIVFDVGGVFPRTMSDAMRGDSNITVACQSAPGPVVLQETIHFYTETNIIIRHCHHRGQGDHAQGPGTDRALDFAQSTDVILDHLSISWHQDAEFQAYNNRNSSIPNARITLQHSLAGRGDGTEPTTPNTPNSALGPHCLSNHATLTVDGCSFLNNYSVHVYGRSLAQWGADGEILNNIIYNFGVSGVSSKSAPNRYPPSSLHAINNLVSDGPLRTSGGNPYDTEDDAPRVIQRDNYNLARLDPTPPMPYVGEVASAPLYDITYSGSPEIAQVGVVSEDIRVLARNADTPYMRCLGASRWGQDVFDRQWINDMYNRVGPNKSELQGPVPRDYSSYVDTVHPAGYDTDGDGIADAWERLVIESGVANSLADIDHTTDLDDDGYPAIEEFLAWRARCPS